MRSYASFGIVAAIMLLLVAAVVYLAVSLTGVTSDLDETTATLQKTSQGLAQQEAATTALEQTNSTLRTDKESLEGYLDDALDRNSALVSVSVGLQTNLTSLGDPAAGSRTATFAAILSNCRRGRIRKTPTLETR